MGVLLVRTLSSKNWPNLAFHDYLKPLGTIVGEVKLFHLRPLDMKSEVSGPFQWGYCPPKYGFSANFSSGIMLGGEFCEKLVEGKIFEEKIHYT